MEDVRILARTLNDGKLWQAMHVKGSPGWIWRYADEGEAAIMGHLVLQVSVGTPLPTGPGALQFGMLPGIGGEGVSHF